MHSIKIHKLKFILCLLFIFILDKFLRDSHKSLHESSPLINDNLLSIFYDNDIFLLDLHLLKHIYRLDSPSLLNNKLNISFGCFDYDVEKIKVSFKLVNNLILNVY